MLSPKVYSAFWKGQNKQFELYHIMREAEIIGFLRKAENWTY